MSDVGNAPDPSRGPPRDVGFVWALGLGIGLLVFGLLGFVPNPLVGAPSSAWGTPLFLTGSARDVIHLVAGAIVLYAALGLTGPRRANVLIGVGGAGLVLVVLGLISGDLLGLLRYPVNLLDQVLLLAVAIVSIVVGYVARGGTLAGLRRGGATGADT